MQHNQTQNTEAGVRRGLPGSLQLVLWTLWTLAVGATAFWSYHINMLARRPFDALGMTIHCGLVGVLGLLVITVAEMHLEAWRYLD